MICLMVLNLWNLGYKNKSLEIKVLAQIWAFEHIISGSL